MENDLLANDMTQTKYGVEIASSHQMPSRPPKLPEIKPKRVGRPFSYLDRENRSTRNFEVVTSS